MYDSGMKTTLFAQVGFAADEQGNGVAYVRAAGASAHKVLRVPFAVKRYTGLRGREVGYSALTAVAAALHRRGVETVSFSTDDAALIGDLHEHRDVPGALTLSYVRLRCALNQFRRYEVVAAADGESDLTARARSEVTLHVAA
jgi:hypothetical protein